MVTRIPNICDSCIHLETPTEYGQRVRYCNAFPEGIPIEIWNGSYDHRDTHPLDNGITYDMHPGRERVLEAWADRYERMLEEESE